MPNTFQVSLVAFALAFVVLMRYTSKPARRSKLEDRVLWDEKERAKRRAYDLNRKTRWQ